MGILRKGGDMNEGSEWRGRVGLAGQGKGKRNSKGSRLILTSNRMALHRPYLRADPSAYPESTEICWKAAHTILLAYKIGAEAKSTVVWLWWSMTFKVGPYFVAGLQVS